MKLYGYKQGKSPINTIYGGLKKKPVPTQHHLTNAEEAWKYYDSLKKWYTMGVPKAYVDDVWNSFIKASLERTKTGGNLKALPDKKHIGRIKVPGIRKPNGWLADSLNSRGPIGKFLSNLRARDTALMEQMFGNPAWNRANLFANKAHASRYAQLEKLFTSQGKTIIRAEDVSSNFGIATEAVDPRFMSDTWGMSYFDEKLFEAGYVTENYLHALAADFATNEIDDMMLKFHLATPIGKDMRVLAPFGGPWADFWGRYLKDLSRRSQVRGNWFHFTDEKQSLNFVRQRLNDVVNYLPNMRRFSYISRIANAELKGTIPSNPFNRDSDRIMVDFSPVTFLPNGDSPMFAVNPIGGFIPVALIGTAMNILDDDAYFELEDTLEDLFPSTQFFPPEEQWKYDGIGTLGRYLFGGGVLNQTMRSLDWVSRKLGMQEVPLSIDDVRTQLSYGRGENRQIYDKTDVYLNMETNWDNVGDFQEYVNDLALDARNYAATRVGARASVRLGVPVDTRFDTTYVDVADHFIDFINTVGLYDEVVSSQVRDKLKHSPYNEDNKIEALKEIRNWWWDLGNTVDGRAKQYEYRKKYPQIYSLTIPGYVVTELGERLLPELEGGIYESGGVFKTKKLEGENRYNDYLADGLIQVRLPDEKIKHIIHENAAWTVDVVSLIYEKMAEIANEKQVELAERFGEQRGISTEEILENVDMREFFGIELATSDVKNLEDISSKLRGRNYSIEDLGPEVTYLIQEVLKGTGVESPINGVYSPLKIIPYLYAAQKSAKLNPAYVYSSQDPADQTFNKGMGLLRGLVQSQVNFDEDIDGEAQLEFLNKFENKLYALNAIWETTDGQIINNPEAQELVQDIYTSFTIFNHIMGDIYSFEGKNVMSGEQWWEHFIQTKFKTLDLEWKQPLPAEGEINEQTFTVVLQDQNIDAEFQTIVAKKPFKAVKVNADMNNVTDGDTIDSFYRGGIQTIRVIGISAYEIGIEPSTEQGKEERIIAIQQKAFLQQLVDRYQGRLYYVTDQRFGNSDRTDPYGRVLGWLFVENGINGDLADGQGEYIFFSDHFSPTDTTYNLNRKGATTSVDFSKEEEEITKYDLQYYFGKIDIEDYDEDE